MYVYSMDTSIPSLLNKASRDKDISRVDTLGPFAAVLNQVLIGTNYERPDAFYRVYQTQLVVWRATILSQADIDHFIQQ